MQRTKRSLSETYQCTAHLPTVRVLRLQEEAQAQWQSGEPFTLNARAPWAEKEVALPELTDEQKAYIQEQAEKKEAAASADDVEAKGPTSFFHGKENEDYQVRGQCRTRSQGSK